MKTTVPAILITLLLFVTGCANRVIPPSVSGSEAPQSSVASESMPEQDTLSAMWDKIEKMGYGSDIYSMSQEQTLFSSWEGAPPPLAEDAEQVQCDALTIKDFSEKDGIATVTVELLGNIYIDPHTLEETLGYGMVPILPNETPDFPCLAFGQSVVKFEETANGRTAISCEYTKYPHPGLDYLKSETERLQPLFSTGEKPDISKYDPLLADYIWQVVFSRRFVEKPEDLTLYDLDNLNASITLPFASIYDADAPDMYSPNYSMDASLLRLMPNLEEVLVPYRLKDYDVFENMHNLKKLTINCANVESLQNLRVGHTDDLMLYDPNFDTLDMTNINTEALRLNSWSTAVRGFKGCDKIKKLYIMSTRTDMTLVNADTFPNLKYLNMYFYSDTPRVRDFSKLAGFNDVTIDLYLDYQACNNKTLESLNGIKLNDVYITPENGSNPLQDIDASLTEKLVARNVYLSPDMYFQERTGE